MEAIEKRIKRRAKKKISKMDGDRSKLLQLDASHRYLERFDFNLFLERRKKF
jgi:hypothetical protein